MSKRPASVALLERYNRLFKDEAGKDVVFKLSDGEEAAHKCVLIAASDVFARMLGQDMREKRDGIVELPDVDKTSMRVFLRLLYTDHVDATDWNDSRRTVEGGRAIRVMQQRHFNIQSTSFTPAAANWQACALLETTSRSFQVSVKVTAERQNLIVGIVPRQTYRWMDLGLFNHSGAGAHIQEDCLSSVWHDGYKQAAKGPTPVQRNSVVTFRYDHTTSELLFSIDGKPTVKARKVVPPGELACPAVTAEGPGNTFEVVEHTNLDCPIDVLLSVVKLAKKYMVADILSSSMQALKQRLEDATAFRCVSTFEQILVAAIHLDIGAVRLAALRSAEGFEELAVRYNDKALKPEVMHELEAIWPPPQGRVDNMSFSKLS
eukprot:TRINITY_DN21754_c0_g2_i1.p1 TRINITY_DN21754_c0_g2~~TRINITY_DN21754_c0_g2_i1.p1  ORF type:complete len:376 (+),score=68.99 TRINITY_DN21754_c0_g2_i1:59-1186(+)